MAKEKNHDNNPAPKNPGFGHGKMGGGQKAKNFKKSFKQMLSYAKEYHVLIGIAFVLAFIGTVLNIIGPDLIKQMTNEITKAVDFRPDQGIFPSETINMELIGRIGLTLVIFYSLGFIFNYIQGFMLTTVSQRISNRFRRDIATKMNKIPFKYYDTTNIGDILSRMTNDVDMVGQTYQQSFGSLVTAVTMFIGSIVMMFITNWILALTAIGASLIGFVFMMLIVTRSQKYFKTFQSKLGALNGHIEEIYTGHTNVKAYVAEPKEVETFNQMNEDLYQSGWKSQFLSGIMMPLMGFVGNLGYVAVIIVGAILVSSGKTEFGVILAFLIYVRLFTQPLSTMAQAMTSLQSGTAAAERVFEFLEEKELEDESHKETKLTNVKGEVTFDHVKFGYDEEKLVINDFSAKIKPGQKVAIVGPTGAGKTTLVNLLMRFYELNEGRILIDGVDIQDITRENVHNLFGMVLQDTWLFEGSVYDNLVFTNKDVTREQVESICKTVGIHFFINTLPEKYDTILTDKVNLSAGQKQLLTIARAMILNAPLLIFDEATSSIDTRTEVLIQKAMDELMTGRTSFVIAHRLSTIRNADLILVMKDGDIVESGNHETLLGQDGFYAELYNSQFDPK
ncbi:ABC transporter ATP-binding protein [Acholeplasma laidlawii]|uniref:ABC-type transport system, permease and ATPase components n=2 Tax=Acholeplasma laidlawii TaxID=2148 RepID=A9NHK6_ACHLI|nr:ABC transporter ATP-binding protein [Acholeplasma laidlawii]ABX81836.1 ABC-type transport system, permease and ATPase components [Acholeplasma laidlawii PG-8A]NWH12207.1 ABC transporter ATP-binding protein [Acholeplasma laidlawii]NWH13593.1 ABC transporter ATP-binding protein [Acholeplasma laidlawii]NWH14240.1 ABC transporter ATP-binding protein [Acholeplasma laidlawii]OAN20153.1 ABC transporter [Acholeplasma laidlawii]